ncbi:hypothetical protein NKG94_32720 [Micromonospora sp. M12]
MIAALPSGGRDHVESLAIDDKPVENAEALATGTATLGLLVQAGNSVEARYQNYALVNGQRVDLVVTTARPVRKMSSWRFRPGSCASVTMSSRSGPATTTAPSTVRPVPTTTTSRSPGRRRASRWARRALSRPAPRTSSPPAARQ